jgi:hypothetical protein
MLHLRAHLLSAASQIDPEAKVAWEDRMSLLRRLIGVLTKRLAAGRADLYAHGGQRLWDYAGGALVFAEAGGAPCLLDRWDGDCRNDLTLRKRIAVGAAHPALQAEWLAWLRAAA